MVTWDDLVHQEIRSLVQGRPEATFTRQELLQHSDVAFGAKSTGKTPRQNVSQSLQHLRDAGVLEFVEPGRYRVLIDVGEPDQRWQQSGPQRPAPREATYTTTQTLSRNFQNFLRSHVIPNFHHACGVCGLSPEWFLDVAHLRPVREFPDLAGDAGAAVALCGNHHKAMDSGALTIEKDMHVTIRLPDESDGNEQLHHVLAAFEGKSLREPHWALTPDALPSVPPRRSV